MIATRIQALVALADCASAYGSTELCASWVQYFLLPVGFWCVDESILPADTGAFWGKHESLN